MSSYRMSADTPAYNDLSQWLTVDSNTMLEPTGHTERPGAAEASNVTMKGDSNTSCPGHQSQSNEIVVDLTQHSSEHSYVGELLGQLTLTPPKPQELGQATGLKPRGFPKLPQELQDMIWNYLRPGPRNIEICAGHHPMSKCDCSWCQNVRVVQERETRLFSHDGEIISQKGEILYDPHPVPILMHINKSTRHGIMGKWQFYRLRGRCHTDPGVLINFEIDILCLSFRVARLLPDFFKRHAASITQIALDLKILQDLVYYHTQTDKYLEKDILCHLPNLREVFLILDCQRIIPHPDPYLPCRKHTGHYGVTTQLDDATGVALGWTGHSEPLLPRLMRTLWRMEFLDEQRRTWHAKSHKAKFTLKILREEWTEDETMESRLYAASDWCSDLDGERWLRTAA